ncbi:MAG: FAD-dependent oxidoreductase [Deltaproteobacteria bacterium]
MKKVVIIGGVAAGASCAARLRRLDEQAEIIVLERGEYISFANCGLPYYIGGVITRRQNLLLNSPESLRSRFNIDVRIKNEVTAIFPRDKYIEVADLSSGDSYRENYDYLVLAPGAATTDPGIAGSDRPNVFKLRNIPDTDQIKNFIMTRHPRRGTVLGAGFIGLEMLEMLHSAGLKVSLVESGPQVMRMLDPEMAAILQQYLRHQGIDLILNAKASTMEGNTEVSSIVLEDGQAVPADVVVMGLGVRPENTLARNAGLDIGATGGVVVNEFLQTSDPHIYAAGDVIESANFFTGEARHFPMASPANRQGWLVAGNIAGVSRSYPGVQGTSIVKVMDMVAAATGANEKDLQRSGQPHKCCHLHPASHATYYPGASMMTMKLIFTPEDGHLLGAQIVGFDGVDKRIDVLATAMRAGLTIDDLQELELAYAPPFSSAKDPVNMAAYVAGNILDGNVDVVYWWQVADRMARGSVLIDVRTPAETAAGMVPGAINIPVDNIRGDLEKIPRGRELMVYCRVGQRSYIASRILKQHGFDVKNISGGYLLYQPWQAEQNSK